MMLCTMTLMCHSQCGCWWYLCSYIALGFGTACSLLYLVENRFWLVMFLRKLYRPLSLIPSQVSGGFVKCKLEHVFERFSFGTLEQGTGGECGWGS